MPDGQNFDQSALTPEVRWPQRATNQTSAGASDSDQWLRKFTMSIAGGDPIDLTPAASNGQQAPDLRVTFLVKKTTNQSPNLLTARIYNLKKETMQRAITNTRVEVSAGYQKGRFGIIFKGTIVQFRRGKENPVDSYLEVIGGDGDLAYGFDSISLSWDKGTPKNQTVQDAVKQLKGLNQEVSVGNVDTGDWGKQKLLRSQAAIIQISSFLRSRAAESNSDVWIDDGKVNFLSRRKYMPGEAAVLKPSTGLIGMPEVTPQGIQARCLLNPNIVLGGLVKIDTDLLSGVPFLPGSRTGQPQSQSEAPGGRVMNIATWSQQFPSAFTSPTGTYKVILLEHSGDTRGNPWYSDMVCVALDQAGNFIPSVDLPYSRVSAQAGLGS